MTLASFRRVLFVLLVFSVLIMLVPVTGVASPITVNYTDDFNTLNTSIWNVDNSDTTHNSITVNSGYLFIHHTYGWVGISFNLPVKAPYVVEMRVKVSNVIYSTSSSLEDAKVQFVDLLSLHSVQSI